MKKKLLVALTGLLTLAGLAACGPKFSDKVLACEDANVSFYAVGGWGSWDPSADNKMTATSILEVSKLDNAVASTLNGREVEFLYVREIEVGKTGAGWTARCKKDGKIYVADGAYTVKSLRATYDPEEESYLKDQWVSDPKTAHCESLTPSTLFFPTWTEEEDEDGFAWNQNPVCIGGAGVYTQVVAQYKGAASADKANFGMALILKEAKTAGEGVEWKEEVQFVPGDHTYGLIGSMTEWATDIAMTKSGNEYVGEVTVAKDDEFKIRADGEWTYAWGAGAVKNSPEGAFDLTGDNIKVVTPGTYSVTLGSFTKAGTAKITIAAK